MDKNKAAKAKAAKAKADKANAQWLLDRIRDGQVLFTRAATGWMIVGPAAAMVTGRIIDVTRADGTTTDIKVGEVTSMRTLQGVEYSVAKIDRKDDCGVCSRGGRRYFGCPVHGEQARADEDAKLEAAPPPKRTYDEVYDSTFGVGRRFHDQPGATQYDDGSGKFTVQIWDNA